MKKLNIFDDYNNLSEDNKRIVDDLSSEIFSKEIDLRNKVTIDVEGDKRANTIIGGNTKQNGQIKHLYGLSNDDIYSFPTISGRTMIIGGQFSQIQIDGIIINETNSIVYTATDEYNNRIANLLRASNGKEYYLTNCDDNGNDE